MRKALAVVAILVGVLIVGFNPNRWDTVLFDLPRGHGIHLHEVVGLAVVAIGVALLWRSPLTARS